MNMCYACFSVLMCNTSGTKPDFLWLPCPVSDLLIGGSSDLQPLIQRWVNGYKQQCTATNLLLEQEPCSSTCGARRACATSETDQGETPLDVGTLSREWRDPQATTNNGFLYQCTESSRELLSLDAAIFTLTFAVGTEGAAHDCINILGGLTTDQLRWIYSNWTQAELINDGWHSGSLKNNDGNDDTHLWSELDARCANEEIIISGGDCLRRIAQRLGAAKLLEAHQVRMIPSQIEEEVRLGFEPVIGAVVDDGRQVLCCA